MSQNNEENKSKFNIAYSVSKFFLDNTRTTILALIFVIVAGVGSLLALTPSGFPNVQPKFAIISTFYQGASAETMAEEITQPIENAIKEVDGISTYTSTSGNSFSNINVSINQDANTEQVISDIEAEIEPLNFPPEAEEPEVSTPSITQPDVIMAIAGENLADVYEVYQQLEADVSNLEMVASADPQLDLQRKVIVTLDKEKLREEGIQEDQIKSQLASIGESIPAVSNIKIDDKNQSIATTFLDVSDVEAIRELEVVSTPQAPSQAPTGQGVPGQPNEPPAQAEPEIFQLSEIAEIDVEYFYTNEDGEILDNRETDYAFHHNGEGRFLSAVLLEVKGSEGADLSKMEEEIQEIVNGYDNAEYATYRDVNEKVNGKVLVVEGYSVNEQNQEQIDEVVNGLIVGIILVFVLMLIFVSWRAAILASVGIPLSLTFTTIYLLLTGNDLNTLVLFSLVLVIGLVVDPALVVLESIQRKKDAGLSGREAALAAMNDVGPGLLTSTLTNIIVFLPMAVVTGVLGQIFGYIPATIMPALVGSYVVAVVFLSWLGGGILKKSKKAKPSEEENLWPIARWFIRINERMLNVEGKWPRWLSILARTVFIILALVIPVAITGTLFSTGALKQVQFASDPNTPYLQVSASYLNSLPQEERLEAKRQVLETVTDNEAVYSTIRLGELNYFVLLKDMEDRGEYSDETSVKLAQDLEQKVRETVGDKFFELEVAIVSNGPQSPTYQVNLAVKSNDLDTLESASRQIADTITQQVCKTGPSQIEMKEDCSEDNLIVEKVDDGYTDKEARQIDIVLDRTALIENQLYIPDLPLGAYVNRQIASYYESGARAEAGTVELGETDTEIVLTEQTDNPNTLEDLRNLEITSQTGETFELEEIAEIEETTSKSSIVRLEGETVNQVRIQLNDENANDQGIAGLVGQAVVSYYSENDSERAKELGLEEGGVEIYSEGATAEFTRTFTELGIALLLAVFLIYFLLVVFFRSFTMPLTIMFTIPLTFLGAFPALALFVGDEFGFLETIGLIILVGLVVNVAIYLIDLADQKVNEGWDRKKAIAFASGVRLRPIFLTNITAIASLAPLFFTSDFYKSIATVIMFGLTTSAITSLFTTPVLYIFFKWLSGKYQQANLLTKVLFILMPAVGLVAPFAVAGIMQTEETPMMEVLGNNPWLFAFYLFILTPIIYMIYWIVDEIRHQDQNPSRQKTVEGV